VSELKFETAGVLGTGLVSGLFATTRVERVGLEHYHRFKEQGEPVIFVFWHGLLLPLVYYCRNWGAVVLVSEHADGEYITRVIERLGFGTVRGSSTRGGTKGLKGLIRAARAGKDLALTPDRLPGAAPVLEGPHPLRSAPVGAAGGGPRHAGPLGPGDRGRHRRPDRARQRRRRAVRPTLSALVRRWWAGEGGWPLRALTTLTGPLEWAYRSIVAQRNRSYDARGGERIEGVRVVSLGNLTVGGTGKTPLSAWVARLVVSKGVRAALVTRGYGQDELLLHRRWNPGVPVVADPDRLAAARRARDAGADTLVLDDGFQHRRLGRDVDLVLLAAEDPLDGHLLPRGPFREPASALARADGVVVTRRTASPAQATRLAAIVRDRHPGLMVGIVALLPGGWTTLAGAPAEAPDGAVLAVTAVARPEAFASQVESATGSPAELLAFPDHHAFTENEARGFRARARGRTLVVTEKDAVKLVDFEPLLGPARVLIQDIRWEQGEEALTALIVGDAPRREA
jgi:tetraacyldisaccharide 4'-kinase